MDNKLIPIIGVVAVIAVAAIAVGAFSLGGNNGSSDTNHPFEIKDYGEWDPVSKDYGLLTVFGNANGDSVINSDDVALIKSAIPIYKEIANQKAIASSKTATDAEKAAAKAAAEKAQQQLDDLLPKTLDASRTFNGETSTYYMADANCDGKIDNLDLNLVQKIIEIQAAVHNYNKGDCTKSISQKELIGLGIDNVKIYIYDVDYVIGSFSYPLTGDMAVGYKSNYESILILGAQDRVTYACNQVADSSSTYYKWYHQYFADANNIGSRFSPDYETFLESGVPQCFITGTRNWFDANMESTLAPMDVTPVRLPFYEDNVCDSSVVTLGFLIGCQDAASTYAQKVNNVLDQIAEAVKDIKMENRPFVFQSYNGTKISKIHEGIHEAIYYAGGQTVLEHGYAVGSIDIEEVNTAGKMDAEFIGLDQYYGFLENWDVNDKAGSMAKMIAQLKDTTNTYMQAINQSQAYQNGKVFGFNQGTYMGPASYITIAYIFNTIYKDNAAVTLHFDVDALFADYLACYHPEYKVEDFVYNGMNAQYYSLEEYLKVANA